MSVAYAQVGVIDFFGADRPAIAATLRAAEAAPAVLNGTPLLTGRCSARGGGSPRRRCPGICRAWRQGATTLLDVTVNGARAGDLAQASLVSSTRFIELDAAAWSNKTVRVMARNISAATFDLAAATLSVQVVKRRIP